MFRQNEPNSQEPWIQSVGGPNQPPSSEQPWGTQPGEQDLGQGGVLSGPVHMVRQDVQNQMNGLIDHLAGQVPGGHMFAPEAKQAVAGILDGLQRQLESQAESRLGGMGGQLFGEQNTPPNQGGQL
jgi:hypothetical protein